MHSSETPWRQGYRQRPGQWSFASCHLTAQDFRVARKLFGKCIACTEGKMTAPPEPTSLTDPARSPGERCHLDLHFFKVATIGGNKLMALVEDEKTSFLIGIPMKDKSAASVMKLGLSLLTEFNTRGYKVSNILTDDEICLTILGTTLGKFGVKVSFTPAGLHEKRIERHMRTFLEHRRAVLCSLSYELPAELDCELCLDTLRWLNAVPNTATGPLTTPYQLFTGTKSFLPEYYFGQVGLFHSTKSKEVRSDWGIFVGYGQSKRYLRMYMPLHKQLYSRFKFEPQQGLPLDWGFLPHIRPPDSKVDQLSQRPEKSMSENRLVQTGEPLQRVQSVAPITEANRDDPVVGDDSSYNDS